MGTCFLPLVKMPCFAQELHQYPVGMKIQDDHGKTEGQHHFTMQNPCGLGISDYFGNKVVYYFK